MNTKKFLYVCFGAALVFPAASIHAESQEKAMQVQIDPKTGRKIPPDDSAGTAPGGPNSATLMERANSPMPMEGSTSLQTTESGVPYAKLGLRQLKFLKVQIGPDGKRRYSHEARGENLMPAVSKEER